MTAIATFHFAAQASGLKYLIAPSASVTATGDSLTGIGSSAWEIVGTAGSVPADWVLSAAGLHSVVVTAPAGTNKAAILQRTVTSGRDTLVTTAKLYSGTEAPCTNETFESDAVDGWGPLVNATRAGTTVLGDNGNNSAFIALLSALSTAGVITDSTSNVLGAVGAKSWFTASAGVNVADAAVVPTWRDRVSGLVMSEATNRPAFRASEINGYPAVDFDGTNDKLTSATVSTDYVANGADFSIVAAVKIDAITAAAGNNVADCVFADTNSAAGMLLWNNAGTYTLLACAYDGSYRYANKSIGTVLATQGVVLEMRLSGGNLIASVNGVDGTPYAGFGTLSALAANFVMGDKGGANRFNGKIAECATFSVGTKQTAVINAFMSKYVV